MTQSLRPFHLAFPVKDLEETRDWYTTILGCSIGRESSDWIDFNLFGHQIVAHLSDDLNLFDTNEVDGENVPVRHFGVILEPLEWIALKEKLISNQVRFIISPTTRFKNKSGEQSTMFIQDPSGNALEFKSFSDDDMIFKQ
tara:strand:- start:1388 stop:1810 length:423 start_codon:yes stop_codon:yes gene_type:complete